MDYLAILIPVFLAVIGAFQAIAVKFINSSGQAEHAKIDIRLKAISKDMQQHKDNINEIKSDVVDLTLQTAQVVSKLHEVNILTDTDFIKDYYERKIKRGL